MSPSRRAIPLIAPEHLRDHADEERLERVWERLEPQVMPASPKRARTLPRLLLSAAIVAGFALGIGFDRWLAETDMAREDPYPEPLPAALAKAGTVYAAGSNSQDFSLPGGGRISVAPDTVVEVVTVADNGLTLRLIHGEASLSTVAVGSERTAPLAVLVGEASVTAERADLRIRHSGESAELEVLEGSARVASPDAQRGVRRTTVGANQKLTVPIRIVTAVVAQQDQAVAVVQDEDEGAAGETENQQEAPAKSWRQACDKLEYGEALALLKQEGDGMALVAAATNADDLMCFWDAFRKENFVVAEAALTRVANEFPTSSIAPLATYRLGNLLNGTGRSAEALGYYERYLALSPQPFAAEALCKIISIHAQAGHAEPVLRLGQQYLSQYPDDSCQVKQLMAAMQAKASAKPDPNNPPADSAKPPPEAPEPSGKPPTE